VSVELGVVPHETQHLIVVASPVRKPANILAAFLQSLAWQVKPRQVQVVYLFCDDGCEPEARKLLDEFVAQHGGMVVQGPSGNDFSDQGPSHHWTGTAMDRVGQIKDGMIRFAIENRAEALWLVDADLILDPMTLTSLWSVPEPIVSGVYWTRWTLPPSEDHPPIHSGPQVWLEHPYQLAGMGLEEWEFRKKLIDRQLTEVRGLGACTLIRRTALMKGVSFHPWPGNQYPGIGQGEDRHFCMRAEALHLKLVADPWPDIFHVYHRPSDEALIPEYLTRLRRHLPYVSEGPDLTAEYTPADGISVGDLVSLELTALEPIPTQQGPMHAPAQFVRGRLGQLPLHPELGDAILGMQRGETAIHRIHFGQDWPFQPYRDGKGRLIRVTLIDHKPYGFAPVIEEEILSSPTGWIDTTTCQPELLDRMREIHA
jgi:hypothetical protein